MITPETAIAKIKKLPPDQLNQVMIIDTGVLIAF